MRPFCRSMYACMSARSPLAGTVVMSGISGSDAADMTSGSSLCSNGRKTTAEPASLGSTVGNTRSLNQRALRCRSTRVNQNVNAFTIWRVLWVFEMSGGPSVTASC